MTSSPEPAGHPRRWTDGDPEPDGVRVVRDRRGHVSVRRDTGTWHSAGGVHGTGCSWEVVLRDAPIVEIGDPELVAALVEIDELKRRIAYAHEEVRAERSPLKRDGDALFITQESRYDRLDRIKAALEGKIHG